MSASRQHDQAAGPRSAPALPTRSGAHDTIEAPVPRLASAGRAAAAIAALTPPSALATGCLCFEDEFGGFVVVPIADRAMRIGRGLAADIPFEDPTVSRRHALVARDSDQVRVLDDRSLNGLFVNGVRVHSCVLEDGDVIGVGRHHLHYRHRPERGRRDGTGEPALAAA